ncbi:hypothetical protein NP493_1574g00015 [Ridgeia piscesae]|uniref:Uncharacterized protein n=1 Tax=Ridgeia piscesae TaxID=27915 RepID=A0AAD9JXM0_RIDPI|nr:hypothetical protein NP493_1574g00015 [Ridgeia piscesae]
MHSLETNSALTRSRSWCSGQDHCPPSGQ